jgi:predicted ATPase
MAGGSELVGRVEELAKLRGLLESAEKRHGRLVFVSGEAGIGKTRLADVIFLEAEAGEFTIAWGRSWEGEGTPAYWPWLQALRSFETTSRVVRRASSS